MATLANIVRVATATTGTGTITLGSAVAGFKAFPSSLDGKTATYAIEDGNNREIGRGVYTHSGTTLTRATILASTNSDAAISLSGAAEVFITAAAEDFSDPTTIASQNTGPIAGFRNAIINGHFMVAQRGASFTSATTPANNDDTYLLDRWILLGDGNDAVDVTQSTTAPTNGLYSIALDVETANKKFGIFQIIEQKNCIGLIGNTVTLSFKAKVSATTNLDNLKAAIIAWDGTADTVTSDIISAWGIEGTNPTLVANWTYENTPANLTPTTSFATYSVTATVDTASAKNIGVFIWSDVTTTTVGGGDILYVTDVQLEIGSTATIFERRSILSEIMLCQRYMTKSARIGTAPANGNVFSTDCVLSTATAHATTELWCPMIGFPVTMRSAPTLTFYRSDLGSSAGNWNYPETFASATTSVDAPGITDKAFMPRMFGTFTDNNGYPFAGAWKAEAEL